MNARFRSRLIIALAVLSAAPVSGQLPAAKTFPDPAVTAWAPVGCRLASGSAPALPPRSGWHNLHGDAASSDEVAVALAPVLRTDWTAEAATYNPTGPVFDRAGNLYVSPFVPYENVVLFSLDPRDGSRRWAIAGTGAPPGASAPVVLVDPNAPGSDIVYLALYDRALAVRTDGSIVWDVATGLSLGPNAIDDLVLGLNYVPSADALVALTADGQMYALDRATGAPLLSAPFALPGERTPSVPSVLPPAILAAADQQFRQFVDLPAGTLPVFIGALLGNGVKVANMFSVDARTGRMWVAATAPDGEDGTVDGVSQLGALYALRLVDDAPGHHIEALCHRSFVGGSASTPTLSADGARVYVGDNTTHLLAIGTDCTDRWSVDVGAQIFGSVAASSDRQEIYTSTQLGITKVVDQGAAGAVVWSANLDVFDLAPGQLNLNMNLVAIGANGLAFQAGAGVVLNNTALPSIVGTGVLDRETGAVRAFTGGGEETVAVMSTGPDGAIYLGNSPLRRIFARVLGLSSAPLTGGVTKFASARPELLMRDAACAAAARLTNAAAQVGCADGTGADVAQAGELIAQIRAAAPDALADGGIRPIPWSRLNRRLANGERFLAAAALDPTQTRVVKRAARPLARVCRKLSR
jgi:outer membrane protein assembly factor BamB